MNSRNVADVEIEVRIISESGSGIKVTDDDETTVWLPKSQIKIDRSEINNLATITLPEWLAIQKGLV